MPKSLGIIDSKTAIQIEVFHRQTAVKTKSPLYSQVVNYIYEDKSKCANKSSFVLTVTH